jgi:hypothetical protein
VKWVILAVVVILAAPSIANRLTPTDANPNTGTGRRRGLLYRAVRRFGLRRVGLGFTALLVALAVLAYLLIRGG